MPANYACHRFGCSAISMLPGDLQRKARLFRRLFNAGLHGPDLFFYYSPWRDTAAGALRDRYHSMSGRDFFSQAAVSLKQAPSEGGIAFLYGLLGHYCLMSRLSPLLKDGPVSATELEVELDRYLLSLDGRLPAHTQDISSDFCLTRGECVTAAEFFPPATAAQIHSCIQNMSRLTRQLAAKNRSVTAALLAAARPGFRMQWMQPHADHRCVHLDESMLACFRQALDVYPAMAEQLHGFLTAGTTLGPEFDAVFL